MGGLFQKETRPIVVFFVVALVFFGAIQLIGTIPDPDTFYHAKIADFLAHGTAVKDFIWLPFTTWADRWADPHFGYHLLLVPFVKLFDPLVGIRVAGVLFAALAATAVVWILRKEGVRHAHWIGALLLVTEPFVFRMSLAKAPAVSLIFLLVIWLIALKSRQWPLTLAGFLYVWLYNAWLLAFVAVGSVFVASVIARESDDRSNLIRMGLLRRYAPRNDGWSFPLFLTLGVLLGIIANPYFPHNISFMWDFIVRSGVGASHRLVQIGGEWNPFGPVELFAGTLILHIIIVAALVVGIAKKKLIWDRPAVAATIMMAAFYAFTLYARRNVEYFVPFAVIWIGLASRTMLSRRLPHPIVATAIIVVLAAVLARDSVILYQTYEQGYRPDRLKNASAWLASHAAPGEIIMHSNWSEMPMLFYWNDANRYIAGLDPTFFFFKDPERYRLWEDLRSGHVSEGIAAAIRNRFGARHVVVTKNHDEMRRALETNSGVHRVFHDDEADVFQIN